MATKMSKVKKAAPRGKRFTKPSAASVEQMSRRRMRYVANEVGRAILVNNAWVSASDAAQMGERVAARVFEERPLPPKGKVTDAYVAELNFFEDVADAFGVAMNRMGGVSGVSLDEIASNVNDWWTHFSGLYHGRPAWMSNTPPRSPRGNRAYMDHVMRMQVFFENAVALYERLARVRLRGARLSLSVRDIYALTEWILRRSEKDKPSFYGRARLTDVQHMQETAYERARLEFPFVVREADELGGSRPLENLGAWKQALGAFWKRYHALVVVQAKRRFDEHQALLAKRPSKKRATKATKTALARSPRALGDGGRRG